MKAARRGISTSISRAGVTAVCDDLAERLGVTVFGHAAQGRPICYAFERFDAKGWPDHLCVRVHIVSTGSSC